MKQVNSSRESANLIDASGLELGLSEIDVALFIIKEAWAVSNNNNGNKKHWFESYSSLQKIR